jgi:hypothetical protein
MSAETAAGSGEGTWCVVANVRREHPYGPGGAETKVGTRQFRGGTKVYVAGCYAGTCGGVIAIGLHRKSRRFITCVVNVTHLEHFRAKLVYHPRVLQLIQEDERCRIKTKEEAEKWVAAFPQWQKLWEKPATPGDGDGPAGGDA